MFGFDFAGAVVELVCDVCALGGDVADLADEGDGGDFGGVDLVGRFGVGLVGVEGLFDGYRAESGVVVVCLLGSGLVMRMRGKGEE